jgi:hypothetical protein
MRKRPALRRAKAHRMKRPVARRVARKSVRMHRRRARR